MMFLKKEALKVELRKWLYWKGSSQGDFRVKTFKSCVKYIYKYYFK